MQTTLPFTRVFYWGKLVAVTASAQAAIQALSLLTGILIIQLLPVREYAYYTIANTVLSTMALLSDSGINNGVMAFGGRHWQDRTQLGAVLATGMDLRVRFSMISLLVSIPILLGLLLHQGAGLATSGLIVLALIPAFFATLTDSVLEIPFKLHQQIRLLQMNQLGVALARFLLGIGALLIFPWAFIPLMANGIPRVLGNMKLRKAVHSIADLQANADPAIRKEMLAIVKRILPLTIYYAYSNQIAIWIISLTGSAFAVAQLGALGRISMVLSLFSVLFASLVTPRFARLDGHRAGMLKRFVQIMSGLALLVILIMSASWLFSGQILMLLGPQYVNLSQALVLSMLAACLNLVSGSVYGLYSSRGWSMQPFWMIGANLLVVVACAVSLDLSSLSGVLIFNAISALAQLVIGLVFCFYKIKTAPLNHPAL